MNKKDNIQGAMLGVVLWPPCTHMSTHRKRSKNTGFDQYQYLILLACMCIWLYEFMCTKWEQETAQARRGL